MKNAATKAVVLGALGYFVDTLDLFLFSVLRVPSLADLGVPKTALIAQGVRLLNSQMAGLLLGGLLFGVLGDRRGRVRALYGSILIYSIATLLNGMVRTLDQYALCRFLAGIGLAGELGAAITLVSESLPAQRRGLGTTLVAGFGVCGGIVAAVLAGRVGWRTCYLIGGSLGLLLLLLRTHLQESALFLAGNSAPQPERRGSLRLLMGQQRRRALYLRLVLTGLPIWMVAGVLMVFSPELGAALGLPGVTAAHAVLYSFIGFSVGDFLSGLLSQALRSRRRAIWLFLGLMAIGLGLYFVTGGRSLLWHYVLAFLLGVTTGYWAVLVTTAAEHFGTNLRATVTTTIPNVVRASTIPLSLTFSHLQSSLGPLRAAAITAVATLVLALGALSGIEETYGRDLGFDETR
jgi:MFS family permease